MRQPTGKPESLQYSGCKLLERGWISFEYFNSTMASSALQRASGQRQG